MLGWIVCISAGYFFFSFLLPWFIVPNLALINTNLQKSAKLKNFSSQLKSKNKEKTLKKAFYFLIKNYTGVEEREKVALLAYKTFFQDIEKIIENRKQFLHCHISNRALMTILINTGQFEEEDFEKKLEMSHFGTIHQYLIVKANGKKFKVDPFYRIFDEILIKCVT